MLWTSGGKAAHLLYTCTEELVSEVVQSDVPDATGRREMKSKHQTRD